MELQPLWPEALRLVPDRPFPRYRFVGGVHPHPRTDPAGSLHGAPQPEPGLPAQRWREDRTYLFGVDLYHAGFLWEAHEQWEACWFASGDAAHRALLQALIQLAAALIQEHKGRANGVALLLTSVRRKLARVVVVVPAGGRLAGLDPRDLLAAADAHFDAGAPPPRLLLA